MNDPWSSVSLATMDDPKYTVYSKKMDDPKYSIYFGIVDNPKYSVSSGIINPYKFGNLIFVSFMNFRLKHIVPFNMLLVSNEKEK